MEHVSLNALEIRANALADRGANWHFHIVLSDCTLIPHDVELAFVLEDIDAERVYFAPATEADRLIGARLAIRLHGEQVFGSNPTDDSISADAVAMINAAHELSAQHIQWHHHLLFPDCRFNMHRGSWTLYLEGGNLTMTALSDTEPTGALAQIERLFYAQP